MQYILFLFLIITSIYFPKTKILAILNFAFIWTLVTFNYYRPDYTAYLNRYNYGYQGDEIGYTLLSQIFRNFNLPFGCMIGFLAAVNLILLFFTFERLTDNIALATVIYMLNCFADLIQIRNFTMMAIALYCIRFLDMRLSGGSVLVYLFGILLASTFHSAGLIYLIVPFLPKLSFKKILFASLVGSVIIFCISFSQGYSSTRLVHYLKDSSIIWKAILFYFMYLIFFVVGIHGYLYCDHRKLSNIQTQNIILFITYVFVYNSLIFRNLNFHRFFRNIMPLLDAQYTELFVKKQRALRTAFLVVITSLMLCEFFYNFQDNLCFFKYNYIFDLL